MCNTLQHIQRQKDPCLRARTIIAQNACVASSRQFKYLRNYTHIRYPRKLTLKKKNRIYDILATIHIYEVPTNTHQWHVYKHTYAQAYAARAKKVNVIWMEFKTSNPMCMSFLQTHINNSQVSNILTATHCNTLQHTATHCNTLQHTATHCNSQICLLHTHNLRHIWHLRKHTCVTPSHPHIYEILLNTHFKKMCVFFFSQKKSRHTWNYTFLWNPHNHI